MITDDGFLECIILYNALCTMHAGETMHCKPCYKIMLVVCAMGVGRTGSIGPPGQYTCIGSNDRFAPFRKRHCLNKCRPGLLTYICATQPQCVNKYSHRYSFIFSLNVGGCRFDNFFVAGATVSCRYDKLRCHRWRRGLDLTIFCFRSSINVIFTPDFTVISALDIYMYMILRYRVL